MIREGRCVGPRREILDPSSGEALGFAGRRTSYRPSWLRWLIRPCLEIHELEDESLLFTLLRPWFHLRAWEVFDAEEHLVGGMKRDFVLDCFGRMIARAAPLADGAGQRFLGPHEDELGTLVSSETGSRLEFAVAVAGNPFAKMLLLAGALALTDSK